jgi:hypothetical protein
MPSCLSKVAVAWLIYATSTAGAHKTLRSSSSSSLQSQRAYEDRAAVRHDRRRVISFEAPQTFLNPLAATDDGNALADGVLAAAAEGDQSEQPSPGTIRYTEQFARLHRRFNCCGDGRYGGTSSSCL